MPGWGMEVGGSCSLLWVSCSFGKIQFNSAQAQWLSRACYGVSCVGDLPPHGKSSVLVQLTAYPLADMYVMFDEFTGGCILVIVSGYLNKMFLFEIGTLVYKYVHFCIC